MTAAAASGAGAAAVEEEGGGSGPDYTGDDFEAEGEAAEGSPHALLDSMSLTAATQASGLRIREVCSRAHSKELAQTFVDLTVSVPYWTACGDTQWIDRLHGEGGRWPREGTWSERPRADLWRAPPLPQSCRRGGQRRLWTSAATRATPRPSSSGCGRQSWGSTPRPSTQSAPKSGAATGECWAGRLLGGLVPAGRKQIRK